MKKWSVNDLKLIFLVNLKINYLTYQLIFYEIFVFKKMKKWSVNDLKLIGLVNLKINYLTYQLIFLWNISIQEDEEMIDEWSKTHTLSEFKDKLLDLPILFYEIFVFEKIKKWSMNDLKLIFLVNLKINYLTYELYFYEMLVFEKMRK